MKKSFENMKEKAKTVGSKIQYAVGGITAATLSLPASVGCKSYTVNTNVNAGNLVGNFIGVMLQLLGWVGAILLVWGVAQFFMAMRDDNADSKHKATMVAVAGVGLLGLGLFLQQIGIIS